MDVRGRRLRKQSDEVTAFISSMAFDGQIANHAIRTNMAHMVSLVKSREVSRSVGADCLRFLAGASFSPEPGTVAEDFHQLLEQEAVNELGVEVAGYLNLGKSRNDQVATAIRMELRERILELLSALLELQRSALGVVRRYGRTIIPGYTHLQRAQPVTVAHHFFAYFDSLQRDSERLRQLYARVNLSPMGSAALGGTSVKVDRKLVASLLGFDGLIANAMDGVSSRDVVLEAVSCAATLMIDVSRLSEELIIWSSKEFGFVELSDEYTASSSIMPQKKNPVVSEIVRAKCGTVLGCLISVYAIMKGLPYSYNLDLQETTPHLWRAMRDSTDSVRVTAGMVTTMKFNLHTINESIQGDYSTATGLANFLVDEKKISFRQAHSIVGELVRISIDQGRPLEDVAAENMERVSEALAKKTEIRMASARRVLDPAHYLSTIVTEGGANPRFIPSELERRATVFGRSKISQAWLESSLKASQEKLNRSVREITREVRN